MHSAKVNSEDTLVPKQNSTSEDEQNVFDLNQYVYLQGSLLTLFERLRKRLLNLDPRVREECKKQYIAYKTTTNFVDIEPHKNHLQLFLNMAFADIS